MHTLCLNKENEILTFLVVEDGINLLGLLFEKVGKYEKFTLEFVRYLFEILELPTVLHSELNNMIPAFFSRLIFNTKIWSNSEYAVQRRVLQRAHEFISGGYVFPPKHKEPYKGILTMLYDYFAKEEADTNDSQAFLSDIRSYLKEMLLEYLLKNGNEDAISIIVKFLLFESNYFYAIRDVLYVLTLFQANNKKRWDVSVIRCIERISKNKNEEYDIVITLHMLISYSIKKKLKLSNETPKAIIECYDEIISYSLHLLLNLNWKNLWEVLMKGAIIEIFSKSSSTTIRNNLTQKPSNRTLDMMLKFLDPLQHKSKVSTEETILSFVFIRVNKEGTYKEHYLGIKVYYTLISYLNADQLVLPIEDIRKAIFEVAKVDWLSQNNRVAYSLLIKNLHAFELPVQQIILEDCIKLFPCEGFKKMLINIPFFQELLCSYLVHNEYVNNFSIKSLVESLYFHFLTEYWGVQYNPKCVFWNKMFTRIEECLCLLNGFFDNILSSIKSYNNSISICNAIQFTYFLEDISIKLPSIIIQKPFIELLAKVIIYLNELRILYTHYPSFIPDYTFRSQSINDANFSQREGGVFRVILTLLLKIILNYDFIVREDTLVLKLLKFFIFRRTRTLKIIKELLKITLVSSDNISFTEKDDKMPSAVLNLIRNEKTLVQDKTVSNTITNKDPIYSKEYRMMLIFINVSNLLLCKAQNTKSFKVTLISENLTTINIAVSYLAKILGHITKTFNNGKVIDIKKIFPIIKGKLIEQRLSISPTKTSAKYTTLASEKSVEVSTPIKTKANILVNPFAQTNTQGTINMNKIQNDIVSLFNELLKIFGYYKSGIMKEGKYVSQVVALLGSKSLLEDVHIELYNLLTNDFLQVEKILEEVITSSLDFSEQSSDFKNKITDMQELIDEHNKTVAKKDLILNSFPDKYADKSKLKQLQKNVINEFAPFNDKTNTNVYKITKNYYQKLLNRCPLYNLIKDSKNTPAFNTFTKLHLVTDNIGRLMRLEKIKKPLENPSVLKRISYVRTLFLKKFLIRRLKPSKITSKEFQSTFLIPTKYHKQLLKALITFKPLVRISDPYINNKDEMKSQFHSIKSCVTKTQLSWECKMQIKPERYETIVEMVKVDHSIFGSLIVVKGAFVFTSKYKDNSNEYRLGPTPYVHINVNKKIRKIWRFKDIHKITVKKYNLIRQGIEIALVNRKSVFLVLFSEQRLNKFLETIKVTNIRIFKDQSKDLPLKPLTDEWRKNLITNFEYLMILNKYASRSFNSLSQHFVFPWILKDFQSMALDLSITEFRNLALTTGGISEKKQMEARKKYMSTKDDPGEPFQFGSHYLPGRGVLCYLLRLEPYTAMVHKFDLRDDCPSRHFHGLSIMWNNVYCEIDNNLELIPEFYYLSEFLANQYIMLLKLVTATHLD